MTSSRAVGRCVRHRGHRDTEDTEEFRDFASTTLPTTDGRICCLAITAGAQRSARGLFVYPLSATDLEWVVVRVGLLNNGTPRHEWRAADDRSIQGMGRIARADVAAFMLAQLQCDDWLGRRPVVMY